MKIGKGKHPWGVQKGNRVEYIHAGQKYTGTVVKPAALYSDEETEVQPDDIEGTHMVAHRDMRREKKSNRTRKREYAERKGLI